MLSLKQADIVNLLIKYYNEARHGVYLSDEGDEPRPKRNDAYAYQAVEKSSTLRTMGAKSKTRGGGRCCICLDPFSIQNVSVVVFYCCHGYHMTCLMDSTYSNSNKREIEEPSQEAETYGVYNDYVDDDDDDDGDDEEKNESSSPRMRCILCTTAAS